MKDEFIFGLVGLEESKGLKVADFEKRIFESAFDFTFLNKVQYVYKLNSHREALSVIWSNNLRKVVRSMAEFYFKKYAQARVKRNSFREYEEEMKSKSPENYESYVQDIKERTQKAYYNRQGEDKIIKKVSKQLEFLDLTTLEYNSKNINRMVKDIKKYKGKIHKGILVIRK